MTNYTGALSPLGRILCVRSLGGGPDSSAPPRSLTRYAEAKTFNPKLAVQKQAHKPLKHHF